MLCMCIDIGYGGTGENRQCSKAVLIRQLFIQKTLLKMKQNNDLLCHSQLDGSQDSLAIIC